jgi:hypothetical protein
METAFEAERAGLDVLEGFERAFDQLSLLDPTHGEVQEGISALMFACCEKAKQNPHFLTLVAAQPSIPTNPRLHEALSDAVLQSGTVALTTKELIDTGRDQLVLRNMRYAAIVFDAAVTIYRKVPEDTQVLIGNHLGVLIKSAAQPEGALWDGDYRVDELDSCLIAASIVAPTRFRNSVLLDVVRANLNVAMQYDEFDRRALNQLAVEGCIGLGADDARQLAAGLMGIYEDFRTATPTYQAELLYCIAATCDHAQLHEGLHIVARELCRVAPALDGSERFGCYSMAIKIDPSTSRGTFSRLLEEVVCMRESLSSDDRQTIAVLSFQVDPDGQRDLQLRGGSFIPYPGWLLNLRSQLKAYWTKTERSQGVRDVMTSNAEAMQSGAPYDLSKLLSGPLANLMNDYDSPVDSPIVNPVTPAHWPALLQVLKVKGPDLS